MKRTMEKELEQLRAGQISGDAFVRATSGDWDALAASLVGRWEVPPGVDAEDMRQELLLAMWEKDAVGTWDPARAVQLSRYVVWASATGAKAWLHKQRGAARHRGTAKSRFPVAFSSLVDGTSDERGEAGSAVERRAQDGRATPDRAAEARELLRRIFAALPTKRSRTALEVLLRVGGERGAAAEAIDADADLAIDCRVGSRDEARAVVGEALRLARAAATAAG